MIIRSLYCIPVALAYQLATNPFLLSVVLALSGHWLAGAALLGIYFSFS